MDPQTSTENTKETSTETSEPVEEIIPSLENDNDEQSAVQCWSPRFEFDAPRYTNFSSKKYRDTRRLLNKLVLNQESETETTDNTSDIAIVKTEDNSELPQEDDELFMWDFEDSSDIDEWFDRFHPLHEPLRPSTPPGPLISPEKRFYSPTLSNVFRPQSLKASPLKLDFSSDIPSKASPLVNNSINTPSKGPNTRIGLRSKPARVLKPNGSFNSSPTTTKSDFSSTAININSSPIRTPARASMASSPITLSVSSLTKTFYSNDVLSLASPGSKSPTKSIYTNGAVSLIPSSSPLRMKTKFSEGTASPLRTAVGILQLEEPPQQSEFKKRLTSTTTTAVVEIKQKTVKKPKIEAELEDIKKLLSQHNNRIRPHTASQSNNKRKT